MKYPLVSTRNNIWQANCQKSIRLHTMVFFFSFSPSMNLQGDPSLSDPSISQSLTFPGSSWCGRVLRFPTSTQRNVLLPSENKTMEGLRHKSQIGRRSFRVELHDWASKANEFWPPAAHLHILHVFT